MADEVRVNAASPDGNGFSLDLREKKLGLTGPNVALLLLIIIIGAVAYLRTGTIDKTLKAVADQVGQTEDRVHKRVDQLFMRMDKLLDELGAQTILLNTNNAKVTMGQTELRNHLDMALTKQNELVANQTTTIDAKVDALEKYVEKWFSEIGTRLEWLDHNIEHPDRRLPLRAPSPHDERQKERGR